MARTTIQLSDEYTIELLAILTRCVRRSMGLHGPGFFESTPFQAIRAKFRRDDDSFMPSKIEIALTDVELGALKEALEMSLLMSGNTSNLRCTTKLCAHLVASWTPQLEQGYAQS